MYNPLGDDWEPVRATKPTEGVRADSRPNPLGSEWEPVRGQSAIQPEASEEKKYNVLGGIKDVGKLLYDVPINTVGAVASMWEDDNPEAKHDWKDIARRAQEERNKQRQSETGGEEYVLPFLQRKDIRDASQSTGFSAAAMTGAIPGMAMSLAPVPGARIAGIPTALAGSGTAAYKMDKTMFTQQLIDAARQTVQEEEGRDLSPEEVAQLVEDTKDLRQKHALWEAIPEAVGNVAQMTGIGRIFTAALGKKFGAKVFKNLMGMYGAELGTETITQTGQHNVEIDAGLSDGEKRGHFSPADQFESFKEVGPQTFVLTSLMGGGAAATGAAARKLRGEQTDIADTDRRILNLEKIKNRTPKQEQILADLKQQKANIEQTPEYQEAEKVSREAMLADLERRAANLETTAKSSPKAKKNLEAIKAEIETLRGDQVTKETTDTRERPFDPATYEEASPEDWEMGTRQVDQPLTQAQQNDARMRQLEAADEATEAQQGQWQGRTVEVPETDQSEYGRQQEEETYWDQQRRNIQNQREVKKIQNQLTLMDRKKKLSKKDAKKKEQLESRLFELAGPQDRVGQAAEQRQRQMTEPVTPEMLVSQADTAAKVDNNLEKVTDDSGKVDKTPVSQEAEQVAGDDKGMTKGDIPAKGQKWPDIHKRVKAGKPVWAEDYEKHVTGTPNDYAEGYIKHNGLYVVDDGSIPNKELDDGGIINRIERTVATPPVISSHAGPFFDPKGSGLENAFRHDQKKRAELTEKFAPGRKILKEKYGDSVTLYRANTIPSAEKKSDRTIFSFTKDRGIAEEHAKGRDVEVLEVNVPIDAVMWATNPIESEYIVDTTMIPGFEATPPTEVQAPSQKDTEQQTPGVSADGARQPWEMSRESYANSIEQADPSGLATAREEDWGNLSGQGKRVGGQVKGGMRDSSLQGVKRYSDPIGNLPKEERDDAYASLGDQPFVITSYAKARQAGLNHEDAIMWAYQVTDKKIDAHKAAVQQALADNKPVPQSVLKDYPDLAAAQTKQDKLKAIDKFFAGDNKAGLQKKLTELKQNRDQFKDDPEFLKQIDDRIAEIKQEISAPAASDASATTGGVSINDLHETFKKTSKAVRDNNQSAAINRGVITVTNRSGRQTIGRYNISADQWVETEKHPNPNWAKRQLVLKQNEKYMQDDRNPEDISLMERIVDSQVNAIDDVYKQAKKYVRDMAKPSEPAAQTPKAKPVPNTQEVPKKSEESPSEVRSESIQPGTPVTWKTKSGKTLTGTVTGQRGKHWQVKKDDGKSTFVLEKDLTVGEKAAPELEVGGIPFSFVRKEKPIKHWLLKNEKTGTVYESGMGGLDNSTRPKLAESLRYLHDRLGHERFVSEFSEEQATPSKKPAPKAPEKAKAEPKPTPKETKADLQEIGPDKDVLFDPNTKTYTVSKDSPETIKGQTAKMDAAIDHALENAPASKDLNISFGKWKETQMPTGPTRDLMPILIDGKPSEYFLADGVKQAGGPSVFKKSKDGKQYDLVEDLGWNFPSHQKRTKDKAAAIVKGETEQDGVITFKGQDKEYEYTVPNSRYHLSNFKAAVKRGKGAKYQTAYHGTPHIWPPEPGFPHGRPRLDKIGTGEGAAAYGWGFYITDTEDVGKGYRKKLSPAMRPDNPDMETSVFVGGQEIQLGAQDGALFYGNDWTQKSDLLPKANIISNLEKEIRFLENIEGSKKTVSDLKDILKKVRSAGKIDTGRGALYALDLPDSIILKLLNWDKPVTGKIAKKISEGIKKTIPRWEKDLALSHAVSMLDNDGMATGAGIYNRVTNALGSQEKASNFFRDVGIPGNTHGGVSKGATGKKYVIWDQAVLDKIALLERNGEKLDAIRAAYQTANTDRSPGTGLTVSDIQKRFPKQAVFVSPDGSISIRMKNGLGLRITSVEHIGGDDIRLAKEQGRMDKDGVILGKYQSSEITLNKNLADSITRDHEVYHFLADNILNKLDRAVIKNRAKKMNKDGTFNFKWSDSMEENEANAFAQLLYERAKYRGKPLGKIVQKIVDFFDGLWNIGRQSARKLAREVESGRIYGREAGQGAGQAMFDAAPKVGTKAFSNWFKNSKVVDKDGKPLVVYHGTHGKFSKFKKKKGSHLGFHFGTIDAAQDRLSDTKREKFPVDDIENEQERLLRLKDELRKDIKANTALPDNYNDQLLKALEANNDNEVSRLLNLSDGTATPQQQKELDRIDKKFKEYSAAHLAGITYGTDANIIPVYLSIQKPYKMKDVGDWGDVKAINKELGADFNSLNEFVESLTSRGYDGIIYKNLAEDRIMENDSYIAFSPTQIKSVYNRGTFSPTNPDIRFTFAGPEAATADKSKAFEAQQMRDNGASRTKVWKDTGWWEIVPGSDVFSYEIDDSNVKLKKPFPEKGQSWGKAHESTGPATLGEILSAPELFKAYPKLKDLSVSTKPGNSAAYYAKTATSPAFIDVGEDVVMSDMKSVLLHEIQHGIQRGEGFATGGSQFGVMTEAEKGTLAFARSAENNPKVPAYKKAELSKMEADALKNSFKRYQSLTGEAQSRLTQKRLDMTPAQRKLIPPWKTLEKMMRDEGLLQEGQKPEDVLISRDSAGVALAIGEELKDRGWTPEAAQKTQISSTVRTYEKLKPQITGKVLDYGAGKGLGAKSVGAETLEPFPKNWEPDHKDSVDIPDNSYDTVISSYVLNVVPDDIRARIVEDMYRLVKPGGQILIMSRGSDVNNAKAAERIGEKELITSTGTYQRGYSQKELEIYVSALLPGANVERLGIGTSGVKVTKDPMAGVAMSESADTNKNSLQKIEEAGAFVAMDNPGGDWLANERERAKRLKEEGSKYFGSPTLTLRDLELQTSYVAKLPGLNDEHKKINPYDPRVTKLKKSMQEEGFDNREPIFINVRYDGKAFINEGNHRIKAAERAKLKNVPVEIVYYAGGEGHSGWMSVDRVAKYVSTDSRDIRYETSADRADVIDEKFAKDPTARERVSDLFNKTKSREERELAASRLVAKTLDSLHFIKKRLGDEPYKMHRMLTGINSSTFSTWLKHGDLDVNGNTFNVKGVKEGPLEFLGSLGKTDAENLVYWVAAKRAEQLEAEGRENWLDKSARDQIFQRVGKKSSQGKSWAELNNTLQKYNKNILDVAEKAGLIDPEARAEWDSNFYVPFNRIMEDPVTYESFLAGPRKNKQHISAQIRKLKGGQNKIADPIENLFRNWMFLLDASARNMARSKAFAAGTKMGFIEEIPKKDLLSIVGSQYVTRWAVRKTDAQRAVKTFDSKEAAEDWAKDKKGYTIEQRKHNSVVFGRMKDFGIMSFQKNGQPVYFKTTDQDLFEALSEIDITAFNNVFMKTMGGAKRLLSYGVTIGPAFRIRNLLRDTVHVSVVSKSFKPFVDSARGFMKAMREDADFREYASSGFAFGSSYIHTDDPGHASKMIKKLIKLEGPEAKNRILDTPQKLYRFWEKIGEAGENAARLGLYTNLKKQGKSQFEAGFQARDLMDFSLRGSSQTVQTLTRIIPFLNARAQGLYKLSRSANEDPKAFFTKASMLTVASLALWSMFKDDDRYKELQDWDKWTYYHFWVGDDHYRIPKPFEIGALFSSLPESVANTMNGTEEGKYVWDWFTFTARDVFNVDMPQLFKPVIEERFNMSTFRGQRVVPEYIKKLKPSEQYKEYTSETMRVIGKQLNISPIKLEHYVNGYFSTLGMMVLTATDVVARNAGGFPAQPAGGPNPFGIGIVNKEYSSNKYVNRFYDLYDEVDTAYRTFNHLQKTGQRDDAMKFRQENMHLLSLRAPTNHIKQYLSKINDRIKAIRRDTKMSATEKKERIDQFNLMKKEATKRLYQRVRK